MAKQIQPFKTVTKRNGNSTFVEAGEAQDHGKQGCIDDQGQQHKASSPQHHLSLDHLHVGSDTMLCLRPGWRALTHCL